MGDGHIRHLQVFGAHQELCKYPLRYLFINGKSNLIFVQVFGICCPDPDSKPTKSPIPVLELNSTSTADEGDEDYPLEESKKGTKLPFHCGARENIFFGGDDVPNKQPFFPSIVGVGSGVQVMFVAYTF